MEHIIEELAGIIPITLVGGSFVGVLVLLIKMVAAL